MKDRDIASDDSAHPSPKITTAPFLVSKSHGSKYSTATRSWTNADSAVMIGIPPT